ncbi:hypothetical protein MPL3365_30162 [Mesorhizobium plurifarium]|uniref:Uncharacterized protein n=1 Tax=Mesorhizobium plurifarium TaxID=69974 RepID=A0A090GV17_MESPL|nr:hypothetical protein MPL3365_30162 [Mesorhizobium plurifarium]
MRFPIAEGIARNAAGDDGRRPAGLREGLGHYTRFAARSPHRFDRPRIGGERLQHHRLGHRRGPVAVDVAHDLHVRRFREPFVGADALLGDQWTAGNALDPQHIALAVERRGDVLGHVIAELDVVGIDTDRVRGGDEAHRDHRNARFIGRLDGVVQRGRRSGHDSDDAAFLVDEGTELGDLLAGVTVGVRKLEAADAAVGLESADKALEVVGQRHPPGVPLIRFGVAPFPWLGRHREAVEGRRLHILFSPDIEALQIVRQRGEGRLAVGESGIGKCQPGEQQSWKKYANGMRIHGRVPLLILYMIVYFNR